MSKKTALVFPGQGSQKLGMMASFSNNTVVRHTFLEASEALGYDLWSLLQNGPEQTLNQTQFTQPVILTASVALFRHWQGTEEGLQAKQSISCLAGHSLGEYSALVYAEALSFSSAVSLVSIRGALMQEVVPMGTGAMAAILGLQDEEVQALCQKVSMETDMLVSPVNYNCPLQVVIAGLTPAVHKAIEEAKVLGAKRTVLLAMSVPSHCDLMQPMTDKFREALEAVTFKTPKISILHNVDLCEHQTEHEIRHALLQQLSHPVRWSETIRKMEGLGVQSILECGPGNILTNLNRRIVPNLHCAQLPQQEEVVCP